MPKEITIYIDSDTKVVHSSNLLKELFSVFASLWKEKNKANILQPASCARLPASHCQRK